MVNRSKYNTSGAEYPDPVCHLLVLGDNGEEWPDYAAQFGLQPEHIPELVRLACDTDLALGNHGRIAWASTHAWRALGQMRAEAAIAPLLVMMPTIEGDDVAMEEFPRLFGMIGPPALPPIAAYLGDPSNLAPMAGTVIDGLRQISAQYPECRNECANILIRMLESNLDLESTANGFAVSALIDLGASDAIGIIRSAFERNSIDISIAGDIEDVEIDFRLRTRRSTPWPRYFTAGPSFDWVSGSKAEVTSPQKKIGRNDLCPCGSGKKYKKCCLQ